MVVTDGHLFPPSDMKVRITSWDGRDTVIDLQREWTVDKVKIVAMEHFLRPGDSMKTSLYHKLLHVRLSKCLSEEHTLGQEGVKENDELLLLKRRLPPSAFETSDRQREDRRTPDMATIRKVTYHLPKNNYSTKEEEPINSVDFQTELRRILISLIEASQRVLCLNPSAAKIFKQAEEMLSEPVPQPKIDQSALRQLTDMGFPEPRAKKALILNKMAVMAAMDWLFQNENDPDIDSPLPELQEPPQATTSSQPNGAEGRQLSSSEGSALGELPHYTNILDTIRAFKKREFRPNPRALQRLVEMGFGEAESVEALRMFRNDQDAACDWLLGERRERGVVVEEGLDPSSLVYKAIMDNPTVQLGLNNPRCLLAFLQMLENPMAANQWLNDPETGPILMQVSRIYQMRLDGDRPSSPDPLDPSTPTNPTSNNPGMGEVSSPTAEGATFSSVASLPNSPTSVPPASTSLPSLSDASAADGVSSRRVPNSTSSSSSSSSQRTSSSKQQASTSGSS